MLSRSRLRRWHVWLGWIIALPILFWVVSGLLMVWKPIEEVRGTNLMRDPAAVRLSSAPVVPKIGGMPIASLSLEQRAAGPRWIIVKLADGTTRQADPTTGALLPGLSAAAAVREVKARYTGSAAFASVSRIDPKAPPLDLRRNMSAWQVVLNDGTHFYVDAQSGQVVATRTGWWRIYDFMFGLHVMDLKTREDTSNPLVIGFAIVALVMSVLALILLPLTINRRKRRPIRQR